MNELPQKHRERDSFARHYQRPPEAVGVAHGRVNLIGEHTDYNDGYVLPTAIPQTTYAWVGRRRDDAVHLVSRELGAAESFVIGRETPRKSWVDYPQGLVVELARAGYRATGVDLFLASDVPTGSGLSSSAALEVAVLRALAALFEWRLDEVTMARIGQRAENHFVGAPVGIMDPMACALADDGIALFLDTRDLSFERIALPRDLELVVLDSGVTHEHATGDYRTRRQECEEAARLLGVGSLRELEGRDPAQVEALPSPFRERARHVVTENARVLQARTALDRGDLAALGKLFGESHASMRDDFQVSTPEVDALVQVAQEEEGIFGARLTGGGFGGSIVALAERGRADRCAHDILHRYRARTGRSGAIHVPRPKDETDD